LIESLALAEVKAGADPGKTFGAFA